MANKTTFETINIDDFIHDPINQEKVQSYPPELVGRFNSFIVTAFDDSMTVEMQLRTLIKWIKENIDVTMSALDNMEAFKQDSMAFQNHVKNTLVNLINQFIDKFDDNLKAETLKILTEWFDDGLLSDLVRIAINEEVIDARGGKDNLGQRLDEADDQLAQMSTNLGQRLDETDEQLAQTKKQIDTRGVSVLDYGAVGDGIIDDTEAIQEALNNHTHVYFPADHTFLVSGLVSNKEGARLVGGGMGNTTIKQKSEPTNTPIIHIKGIDSIVSDLKIEGEWSVIRDDNHGIKFDKTGVAQNLHLKHINGDGIQLNANVSKAINIKMYNINGYGIRINSDSQLSNIEAGMTFKPAIAIVGGNNTVTNAFIWMSGTISRTSSSEILNYDNGYGIVFTGKGNTLTGILVMASVMDGISGNFINNTFISGTSKNNGRKNNWNTNCAGFKGRNVRGSTILLNASNDGDYQSDNPTYSSWGWQKHALNLVNFGSTLGNVFNVSAENVDKPILFDDQHWIQLRDKNSVLLGDGKNHVVVDALPMANKMLLGQVLLLKGNSTADTLHVCMQRSTGQYTWIKIGTTD